MKQLLLLLSGAVLAVSLQAQSWQPVADFAMTRRMCPIAFSWNGKGYIGLGHDYNAGASFNDLASFDPNTNRWTEEDFADLGNRTGAFCFVYQNILYVGGGTNDSGKTALRDFYAYDLNSRQIKPLQQLPFDKAFGAKALLAGDKAFILGGCTTDDCETMLWAFDLHNQIWSRQDTLPLKTQFGYAFALQENLYYGGGNNAKGEVTKAFWKYEPAARKWTELHPLPGLSRTMGISIALDTITAVAGLGFDMEGYLQQALTSRLVPGLGRVVAVRSEKGYLLRDLWLFNAGTGRWKKWKHFPDKRRNASAFILDNKLYVGMGNAMEGITKSVYATELK